MVHKYCSGDWLKNFPYASIRVTTLLIIFNVLFEKCLSFECCKSSQIIYYVFCWLHFFCLEEHVLYRGLYFTEGWQRPLCSFVAMTISYDCNHSSAKDRGSFNTGASFGPQFLTTSFGRDLGHSTLRDRASISVQQLRIMECNGYNGNWLSLPQMNIEGLSELNHRWHCKTNDTHTP